MIEYLPPIIAFGNVILISIFLMTGEFKFAFAGAFAQAVAIAGPF